MSCRPRPLPARPATTAAVALLSVTACAGCGSPGPYHDVRAEAATWVGSIEQLGAEDRRALDGNDWNVLAEGLSDEDARVRARSARALGRLERTEAVALLMPLLSDEDARVRAEAANGLAQALWRVPTPDPSDTAATADTPSASAAGDTVRMVLDELTSRAAVETDPWALAVVARSLGRLPVGELSDARRIQRTIRGLAPDSVRAAPPLLLTGIALGLHSLARRWRGPPMLSPPTKSLLVAMFSSAPENLQPSQDAEWTRMRRAALAAYSFSGPPMDGGALREALSDGHPQVRLQAVMALSAAAPGGGSWIAVALTDSVPAVRVAGLRALAGSSSPRDCSRLVEALEDPDPLVAMTAADLLGAPCEDPTEQAKALAVAIAADADSAWHLPARALFALAAVDPGTARAPASALAEHESPFARAWAARSAGTIGDLPLLRRLSQDPHPNVRTEAIRGLATLQGHRADAMIAEQLAGRDPQLLLTAAQLLEGSPDPGAWGVAALDALDRLSEGRAETSRDPRMALLARLGEYATVARGRSARELDDRLAPYLEDFDAVVAERTAAILTELRGVPTAADPKPNQPLPIPTPSQLGELSRASVNLEMEDGGEIKIRLLPGVAPTNAFRFARLARAGYFDGLTFHRVVQNFVIQGGSPGANEYWGDGPFSRDELGLLPHWRGTVGLSTRGRDTGDAQIFVNLVDNLRLDHNYTIMGEVTAGMDVVDSVLEGAVIRKSTVVLDER